MISGIRRQDRLPDPDLPVVDAAVGHHRCAGAFRTETREGLGVPALAKGRDGQQFGRRNDP